MSDPESAKASGPHVGSPGSPGSPDRSALERALGVVTEVRPGEGPTALLMTLNVFLLLSAYYVIKPVREGLILAMESGAVYKAYLGGAIALSLLVAVPLYGRAADRFRKDKLVVGVTLFFASHLVVFYALSKTGLEKNLGLAFFVWVGIFNMMLVAQFWSFANDLYNGEQGKRLFGLIGIGASAGGVAGAYGTKLLVKAIGTYQLMLVSAGILVASAALTRLAASREHVRSADAGAGAGAGKKSETKAKADQGGTFALVFRHRYLVMIAGFSLVFTFVNSNGEYMLGTIVSAASKARAAAEAHGGNERQLSQDFTTAFYGEFFLWVNVLVMILQTFVVSRLVKYGGLKVAFFVLPVIALLDAIGVAVAPVLGVVRIGKMLENATDYSVNNTVRNMLWLPTTTEMKYKAKQAVDTFFVRMGDVAAGFLVWLGAKQLGWSVRGFAVANLVLVGIWVFLALGIIRENARLSREQEKEPGTPADEEGSAS